MVAPGGKHKRFFEVGDSDENKSDEGPKKQRKELDPDVEKRLIEAKVKALPQSNENTDTIKPKIRKYNRGERLSVKGLKDKKLKSQLKTKEDLFEKSALTAAKVEQWLLPSEGGALEADDGENTYDYTQEDIVKNVDISSAHKAFDLRLPDLGPYTIDYTHSGRYALIGGRKGHLAVIDWKTKYLMMETQVKETTRDIKFLHNEQFFAAAQSKYIYIYDKKGAEVHCLKEFVAPLKLEFLRHHFLLVSTNKAGVLHYQDTSTGQIVANYSTRLGPCRVLRANPYNAVVSLGHSNGTVTLWTPNMGTPLVRMLCHRGAVTSTAFDMGGSYMVTAGADARIKVWDIRKMQALHSYMAFQSTKSLDVSQKGLLAVGSGSTIEIWKDAFQVKQEKPYMKHKLFQNSTIQDLSFCPYEDVVGIGHTGGVTSILVPGSGEPNFDSFVANPFQTVKQRHEAEVHALLDKLQPQTIMLDPQKFGAVDKNPRKNLREQEEEEDESKKIQGQKKAKRKTKGRNKVGKRMAKKQLEAFGTKRSIIREQQQQQKQMKGALVKEREEPLPRALERFAS
ncbi:hypothetical protein SELMODRAFT_402172 [Selaginella moellendorffii]|uniref:BING4 C-terminal domain-containing protein n=1 Tax=Selaginella moellendorffii TaxID=88036 RepID=D8QPU0_SELML|nr:probable U3 small nucleolar RNA-associated protein 7 [Selaginella moellendorffii]EFJ37676.1 hypothetical protein SELMODRAFT_402172 [Selaginella moellendorffii]|eukprot:XP_002960137.1 probable U3 small nucleolar RNA-associated protein 7 [Selaginella moellendorffii]